MTAPAMPVVSPSNAAPVRHPLSAGKPLPKEAYARVRRRMLLECCKWDPQVGDVSTLATFPLFIGAEDWRELQALSEQLAAELDVAEQELLCRPDLWRLLAIPRPLRRALAATTPSRVRVLRFDFHWTDAGWRISEVNSDVPGGFAEASALPQLVAAEDAAARGAPARHAPAGNPAVAFADAIEASLAGENERRVALLTAPGFMEDQQVVAYLGRTLRTIGLTAHHTGPDGICWDCEGRARLLASNHALGAIVRFYQAEWLARLPSSVWEPLVATPRTLVVNPLRSVLTESKRFPLAFAMLRAPLPTWRRLLPETRDPRDVPLRREEDGWLLKTAFCNTGDTVSATDWLTPKAWRAVRRSACLFPRRWVAQRRFNVLPIDTPTGESHYPCVGVYTVNGRCAGAYTRLSRGPKVDYRATDVALLVRDEGGTA